MCIQFQLLLYGIYADLSKLHVLTADIASLGEPLQTLSELVYHPFNDSWGERSEPLSYESTVSPPTPHLWVCMYVCMFVCISIFRPTIWQTVSTSGPQVRLFEGPKRFRRRPVRPEEDVDTLFETSDANFLSRRRFSRLRARQF